MYLNSHHHYVDVTVHYHALGQEKEEILYYDDYDDHANSQLLFVCLSY